ncbi:cardiolipin synthase ClsB [Accumulibacter sp.]|uniref:cardiolipin synthase ClsB n=1 Tax=Accumulibacter sp. TaxID=2053492 RepID=UPI0028C4AD1D|nr:cardiolipin synthase ClsB [Accumulibacter sp.]
MRQRWSEGNRVELLENGEAFYPRVFAAIDGAGHEVLLETFILLEDKVGMALQEALVTAAQRGVRVMLLLDGWGSHDLSDGFLARLSNAGVTINVFDPQPWFFGWRPKMLRRMHRKTAVIDGKLAFVGGINYSADHLADYGPEAKQDYSVAIEGSLVRQIHRFVREQSAGPGRLRRWWQKRRQARRDRADAAAGGVANDKAIDNVADGGAENDVVGTARASFVVRDNWLHRKDIERHYRLAIRFARRRIVIANAYFFPGYRLLRDLRRAARRGVDVRLVLQGKPDMAIARTAAHLLHEDLLQAGVRIHEYCERPLHGKVALVDDDWSTVGSSNLDPFSLSLNLEANVIIHDRGFNECLADRLQALIDEKCTEATLETVAAGPAWSKLRSFFVYHALRLYPRLAGMLPAHVARVETISDASRKTV